MPLTEHTLNDALADVLRPTRQAWRDSSVVTSETTGMLKGGSKRPDILVIESNVSPVVIETEVVPAATVESEACSRLGAKLMATGRQILSAVAVRLPDRLRHVKAQVLRAEIVKAEDLEMVLYTGASPSEASRFPVSGWVKGGTADLSLLTQAAGVPPHVIEDAADELVNGVSEAAALLSELADQHPGAVEKISEELRQKDNDQTRRMAATILANAFVFQESLANGPGALASVKSLDELRGTTGKLGKTAILAEWHKILGVNYWPIFDIARKILEVVPPSHSSAVIERLATTATKLLEHSLMRSHDLTGRVFQRLIVDRKFLAAYYTTPASAALLVSLAVNPTTTPTGGDWSDGDGVRALRIADFACGTGTLLSTAYVRLGQLHELGGGNSELLHPGMMEAAMIGCDILPAAAHLTASMLAGTHPMVRFTGSKILTVPYGKQADKKIGGVPLEQQYALGSLDLLKNQGVLDLLDFSAKAAGAMGEKDTKTWSQLPHASFDVVVMNPPFTRPTGHEAGKVGVPVPMFAAFGIDEKSQRAMSKVIEKLTQGTSARGNAGEASIFLVVVHRKLKEGGVAALVMPASLISGEAWEPSRALLRENYGDLIVLSIAAAHDDEMSFSADTGMGECLIIAKKTAGGSERATFVSLKQRPQSTLEGNSVATEIRRLRDAGTLRRLEEGPVGGTPVVVGSDPVGSAIDAPLPPRGGWNLARIADFALAQTAYQLVERQRLWLPSMPESKAAPVRISTVGAIGTIGPYHMDVMGKAADGGIRGPFKVVKLSGARVPTYPVLWSHEAARERSVAFDAESEGLPLKPRTEKDRDVIAKKTAEIWSTASHCHFNRDLRFNSQSTAAQFAPHKSIGGRAWPSVQMKAAELEKVVVLWANTSLGLLLYWWHANRQQAGRGSIGKAALAMLPILDVRTLTPNQVKAAVKLFSSFASRPLKPFNEIAKDEDRAELDDRFLLEVLELPSELADPLRLIREKLGQEPSIKGGKIGSEDSDEDEE